MGGGTPTVLDVEQLKKILRSLRKFSARSLEFTIEANPESLTAEKLSLFIDEGVNRISIGVQSFDNSKLMKLGRLHDGAGAYGAVEKAEKSGFKNISIDLIFGVWDESLPSWKEDLKAAAGLPVKHISCYSLTYEPGSPITDGVKDGSIIPVSEEISADMYTTAISLLADKGFAQYEISSFSKSGFACRHNQAYWNNDPYTGLGPSAVSYAGGVRTENIPDAALYIEKARSGVLPIGSSEKLSSLDSAKETAAVKIRTMEGIDLGWFRTKTGFELIDLEERALPKLIESGLIEWIESGPARKGVRLTQKGALFCDTVSSAFL